MSSDKYLYVKKLIPFEPLQQIEDSWDIFDMPASSKDQIKFLKREFKFIGIFLSLHNFTNESNMLDHVTQKIQILFQDAGVDLSKVCNEQLSIPVINCFGQLRRWDPITDLVISQVQNKIWITKSDIRAKYSFPDISLAPSKNKGGVATSKIVLEFVDAVVCILSDLALTVDPRSLVYIPESKEQIEEVLKELTLLRFFVCFVSNKCIEPDQIQCTFFTHVLIVSAHASMVAWLYSPSEMNDMLSELLQMKIKPILPGIRKIYIDVLLALKSTIQSGSHPNIQNKHGGYVQLPTVSNPSPLVPLNDQMTILQEMLSLLKANLIRLPILDLEDMDAVIVDAGLLIYSLYDSTREKEDAILEHVNRALGLDLPGNIQPIKAMIYLIIQKAFRSNLPRIHGIGYVDFLLNNLKEFQDRYSDSLASVMNQLQIIQKEVVSVQPFLEYVSKQWCNKYDGPQDWATLLIDKAYEVEYVVDACIRKEIPHWCLEHWLSDIIEDITFIRTMIEIKKHFNPVSHDTMDIANCQISPQFSKAPSMNEEIIGFEDVREELKGKLLKGCRELDVISIVGMPGLGKTTLAKKLFYDKSIVEHFDICAQCCVSRVYTRMDLLLTILHDATGERPRFSTEADVAVKFRNALMAKRYLILVDDVWESSVWDDLSCCFYDAKNRSRIILTTRHFEVANYASSVSKPVPLRMFNNDESWKLLEDRVFGKQRCSASLEEVGQQIAKKCRGLPLSIVLVAGILAKTEKKEESWKQVATTLSSQIHNDSKAILEQSYQDLPCHLKPCFLYFGAYLEDRVIDVSTLTRLWISEAFIKSCEGKRLEDIAESYLENLIGRNLVMVTQRNDSDGKVKACRIHDVLLEFCKKRASEENFLLWIKRDHNAKQHAQRRLAFCEVDNLEEWSSSCSLVSSILFRNDTTYFALYGVSFRTYEISRILHNFKFLKVLDLELTVVIDFFPTELVYLRYLSARIDQHSLPSSIANLWNLESLILKCHEQEGDMLVPITIWKMVKLRHLRISNCCFTIENAEELLEDSSKLYYLEALSSPYFSCPEDAKLMLEKTPNLRKLSCKFKGIHRDCKFPVLKFQTRLEALVIFGPEEEEPDVYPVCISASNLKDLTVIKFRLGHQHLSNIAQLHNLQALQLRFIEFDNLEWEVSNDNDFPQLKVLTLSSCFFSKWC